MSSLTSTIATTTATQPVPPITPEEEYIKLYKRLGQLCYENGWGDPFSFARSKEIYASIILNHHISPTLSGPDAYEQPDRKDPAEYKSTIGPKVKGNYTGISVQSTWSDLVKYLEEEKIGPYKHYFNRFNYTELVETWTMPTAKVLEIIKIKLRKKYNPDGTLIPLKSKDPRFSATITNTEILKFGSKVRPL